MTGSVPIAPYVTAWIAVTSRAVTFLADKPCPPRRLAGVAAASIVAMALCFRIELAFWLSLTCVLPNAIVPLLTEKSEARVGWRLMLLPTAIAPFLFPPDLAPILRGSWVTWWRWLQTEPIGAAMFSKIEPRFVVVHISGLLLCLSDCNLVLRGLLRLLGVSPPSTPAETVDPSQYLRGGLVGAVERMLIYVFAANAAFNAIAFVITVKGIVRYQEIVKNHSAEYVLIGTLISTLMAMLIGMLFVRMT